MTTTTTDRPRGTVAHTITDVADHEDTVLQSNVRSIRVYLPGDGPGTSVEVQVAVVDGSLVVIAAGRVVLADRDVRGFARLRVFPE